MVEIQGNTFKEEDIKKLEEDLIRLAKDGVEGTTKLSWDKLQIEADLFLKRMDNIHKVFEQKELIRLKQMAQDPNNANKIFDFTKKERDLLVRSKYLLAFNFDAKIKKFFNQLPAKVLYVYDCKDSEGNLSVETEEMDLTKLISLMSSETTEVGRLYSSASNLSNKNERDEIIENRMQTNQLENYVKYARIAYLGSHNRLERFFQRREEVGKNTYINKKGEEKKKTHQGGVILWKISRKWMIGRVSNEGDLKEAYATLLMAKNENDIIKANLGKDPYYDHKLIGTFFEKYIWNVTNKAAVFGEDIQLDNEKSQWSVKSYKASMPSLKQYVRAAELISKKSELTFKQFTEELEKEFPKDFPKETNRNIFQKYDKNIKDSLAKYFEEETDRINKSNYYRTKLR